MPVDPHHAVEPEPVPLWGTTWVARGAGYWLRRVAVGLLHLVLMAFAAAVAGAFYEGFVSAFGFSASFRRGLGVVQAVLAVGGLAYGFVRHRRKPAAPPPTPKDAWAARRRGGRRGSGALNSRWLLVVAVPVLPAVVAFGVGEVASATFVRFTPAEVGARLDYERRVREAGAEEAARAEEAAALVPRNRAERRQGTAAYRRRYGRPPRD
ncbi:hypothetical protein AB0I22_22340 [Streptomyces sp. NPDC050610]|uniref:hypothetical protein n=1 Tax=Streptomyces sp. NPDC050610 TaxID=3157097 RepID=UPI0034430A1D